MKHLMVQGLFVLFLLTAVHARAEEEVAYVTDRLQLSLYPERGATGTPLQRLPSDTRLVILERSGFFARVRTDDGSTGWVKSTYLVAEKPARVELEIVRAEANRVQEALSIARRKLATTEQNLSSIRAGYDDAQQTLTAQRQSADRLQRENRELADELAAAERDVPLRSALIAVVAALIVGLLAGIAWVDFRMRKRHGGFRFY